MTQHRRTPPRFLHAAIFMLAAAAMVANATAEEGPAGSIRIGVPAPLSGASAVLGAQVEAGARAAAMRTPDVSLVPADTECSAEGGARAANSLVSANVAAVAGFLCTEAQEAALPILTKAGIPVISVGVRANRFTDRRAKTGALIWRVAPRSDAEADAIGALLAARWRDVPFGLVDDGTLYGRGLADAVRSRLEAAGLRAATIDTYRPAEEKQFGLVRRILGTGVTRLFIAGDRPDVAIIARDAASLDLGLEIVGGESLPDEPNPDVQAPVGLLAVAPQNRFDDIAGPPGASAEDRQGYFGPAIAATEIAIAAVRKARAEGPSIADTLNTTAFPTALGPVRFDAEGDSDLGLFRTFRFDGEDFVPEAGG